MGFCCVLLFFLFFLKPAFFSQFLRLLPACHAHPVPPRVPLPRPLGLCSPLGTDAEGQSPPVTPVIYWEGAGSAAAAPAHRGHPEASGGGSGAGGAQWAPFGVRVGTFWGG